jgi:hypothetical protein
MSFPRSEILVVLLIKRYFNCTDFVKVCQGKRTFAGPKKRKNFLIGPEEASRALQKK